MLLLNNSNKVIIRERIPLLILCYLVVEIYCYWRVWNLVRRTTALQDTLLAVHFLFALRGWLTKNSNILSIYNQHCLHFIVNYSLKILVVPSRIICASTRADLESNATDCNITFIFFYYFSFSFHFIFSFVRFCYWLHHCKLTKFKFTPIIFLK